MVNQSPQGSGGAALLRIGSGEFVALVAALMAINSLGVDIMLAALPEMAATLHIEHANDRQWIISAYALAFGVGHLFFGPLADRYGRKPVLIASLSVFTVTSVVAVFADTFDTMLIARAAQGFSIAASRVLCISIVRDRYSGRQMARIMSLATAIFLMVPILAPAIGQMVLLIAPWPAIFFVLALFGALLTGWIALRLPETLREDSRVRIHIGALASAARSVITNRHSMGYTISVTFLFGTVIGFINSAQQLFFDTFNIAELFVIAFAGISIFMIIAAYVNSRVVMRLGTHVVSHAALLGFILLSALHLLVAWMGFEVLWTFVLLQGLTSFCCSLAASNFGAMAMEPMGHIAGTAASIQGGIVMAGSALIGTVIGQCFDGTVLPLLTGFLAMGVSALAAVLVTERGRLFDERVATVTP